MTICPVCRGEGVIKKISYEKASDGKLKPVSDIEKCNTCKGKGHLEDEK